MCYNLGKMEKIALLDVPLKLKKVLPMAYNQKQKNISWTIWKKN